jgi:hypothetical protein
LKHKQLLTNFCNLQIIFLLILVFTHRYGKDGRETKKFEDKCLLFDFEFLKSIADPVFVERYKNSLSTFLTLLNENNNSGMILNIRFFTFSIYLFTDFSNYSTISDVRSFPVAQLETTEFAVRIILSFEVKSTLK